MRRAIQKILGTPSWIRGSKCALPDFYVLGCMKCGTTSLHDYICQHPEVLAASKKEIHFYNIDHDMGALHYRSHFPELSELRPNEKNNVRRITGESTPDYLWFPRAAKWCHELTPNAKFLVIMRNPVDRAFSHYKQGIRFGFEKLSFEDAIAMEKDRLAGEHEKIMGKANYYSYRHQMYSYLGRGEYVLQIEEWLKYFDKSRFLFLESESFFTETAKHYATAINFLGLDDWKPKKFDVLFPGMSGEIQADTRHKLLKHFGPYNEALFSLIGQTFDWNR